MKVCLVLNPVKVDDLPAPDVSGGRHLLDPPMTDERRLDDEAPVRRWARCVVVGNAGRLQAGLRPMPDALPDDGLLDVVVLSPRGLHSWVRVVLHLLSRPHSDDRAVERFWARRVVLACDRPPPVQLDGDPRGRGDRAGPGRRAGRPRRARAVARTRARPRGPGPLPLRRPGRASGSQALTGRDDLSREVGMDIDRSVHDGGSPQPRAARRTACEDVSCQRRC